jgi:hypothetical protein
MSNTRRYKLNKKAYAVTRTMGAGRWEYVYCSPKGVMATNTTAIIRVTLPSQDNVPTDPCIYTKDMMAEHKPKGDELVTMPEGLPAKTTGNHTVPNLTIEPSDKQTAVISVDAKQLIELLRAACEVTDHSRNLVRLRFIGNALRIDAHKDKDGQEFAAVLMGIVYNGDQIPGDPEGTAPSLVNELIDEIKLLLPDSVGRKFR